MTQEYRIWKPEHDGHAPPSWRKGMVWKSHDFIVDRDGNPAWYCDSLYWVPVEALGSPNDDAQLGASSQVEMAIELVTRQPPEVLARYGITLAPEKDWAVELWADLLEAWEYDCAGNNIRNGKISDDDWRAIDLLGARAMPKGSTDA